MSSAYQNLYLEQGSTSDTTKTVGFIIVGSNLSSGNWQSVVNQVSNPGSLVPVYINGSTVLQFTGSQIASSGTVNVSISYNRQQLMDQKRATMNVKYGTFHTITT